MATIAYLTSVYPRASDSFIRTEIAQLRKLGHTVHTFSIRPPAPDQLVSDEIRHEHSQTTYLFKSTSALLSTFPQRLSTFLHSPSRWFSAFGLTHQLCWPGIKGHLWPRAYLAQASVLAYHLRKKNVQHLHNHIGQNSAAVAMLAAKLAGIPHSLTIHGPYEFDSPADLQLGLKIHHSAFTVAISDFTRSQLLRWSAPQDWPKIHTVRCTIPEEFLNFPATPISSSPHTPYPIPQTPILSVGRLCPEKGQLVLLQAVAQLISAGKSLHLTLIGDGPDRPLLESEISNLKLQNHITLAGWQSADSIRQHLLNSHALVLASFNEGLPVVLMEALALRRPVIATHIAGIPELVNPANGWLIPPGNPQLLADALQKLLSTPMPTLNQMGTAGHAAVSQFHNSQTEAQKLSALIQSSVANASDSTASYPS